MRMSIAQPVVLRSRPPLGIRCKVGHEGVRHWIFYADSILPSLIDRSGTMCANNGRDASGIDKRITAAPRHGYFYRCFQTSQATSALAAVHSAMIAAPAPRLTRIAAAVHLLAGSAERIPLADCSIDTVVSTGYSIPDVSIVLREMRVLKPGGRLLVVEHGRTPEPGVGQDQEWGRRSRGRTIGAN